MTDSQKGMLAGFTANFIFGLSFLFSSSAFSSAASALSGTDADVTFVTDDCIYTINGMDITMNNAEEAAEGYSLTYEDYELTKLQSRKIRYTDLLAVKVNVNTDHEVKAELRCFASKDKDAGYLYRVSGQNFTFVSAIDIKNGEAIIPVT